MKALALRRGLKAAHGDTESAEAIEQTISLLHGVWNVENSSNWIPDTPQHKSGVWADLPSRDGRVLQSTSVQNVKESIPLVLTVSAAIEYETAMRDLQQFILEAQAFHTESYQIQPSYIEFWVTDAPGPQYALIYLMDVAVVPAGEPGSGNASYNVTLTVEREPFWRPIPPGTNPKIWTRWLLGDKEGIDYTWSETTADNGYDLKTDPSTVSEAIQNRYESASALQNDIRAKFWITVPKEDIPGDAPALVCLEIDMSALGITEIFPYTVWRSTNPYDREGSNDIQLPSLTMDVMSLTAGLGTAFAADTGGKYWYVDAVDSRLEFTPTASLTKHGFWNAGYRTENLRGRYALIGRMRQDSGSAGDVQIQLKYGSSSAALTTELLDVPLQAGTGNTTHYPLLYMGTIDLPVDDAAVNVHTGGGGVLHAVSRDLNIAIYLIRNTGSALVYFIDIIMVKLDEGAVQLIPGSEANLAAAGELIFYDNTGYLQHGKSTPYARSQTLSTFDSINEAEIRGTELTLLPGVDNLLYFFGEDESGESDVQQDITVRLHVLPRWSGVRDV